MNATEPASWIAFSRNECIASGAPREVAAEVKRYADSHAQNNVLVFDARTSQTVEIDLRGSLSTVLKRLPAKPEQNASTPAVSKRTAGRPKLGVVAREVTLLPRHWEWLAGQPGGASVALRKLVEHGMRSNKDTDRIRQAREAAYRFMNVMAGNKPGFEEAIRALFAGDIERLQHLASKWPRDVRNHALSLASASTGAGNQG